MRFVRAFSLALLVVGLVAVVSSPAQAARPAKTPLLLTPDAVVPGPGDAFATGSFKLKFGRNEVCFDVNVTGVTGFIERIAIHRGRDGFAGPEVVLLSPSEIGIQGLMGCRTIDNAVARDIARNPSEYYVVVKTTAYPDGALRGQLKR